MHTTNIHFKMPSAMTLFIHAIWKTMVGLWAIPTTLVSMFAIKIIGPHLFLTIFGIEGLAETITAASLAISSLIGLLFIFKQKNAETEKLSNELSKMKDDLYKSNIEWLFARGFLSGNPTKAEIDRVYQEWFPEED